MAVNYIADQNPFKLAPPPAWWLQRLADYDSQLVVMPSRQDAVYRLTRRTWNTPGLTTMAMIDRQNDSAMMAKHGVVPVTSIMGYGVWGTNIFNSLRARDIWAHGGHEKFVKKLEDVDAAEEVRKKAAVRDDIWMRSGDAWTSYQTRTRQRVNVSGDNPYGGAGSQRPAARTGTAHSNSSSRSTGTSGIVLATA